ASSRLAGSTTCSSMRYTSPGQPERTGGTSRARSLIGVTRRPARAPTMPSRDPSEALRPRGPNSDRRLTPPRSGARAPPPQPPPQHRRVSLHRAAGGDNQRGAHIFPPAWVDALGGHGLPGAQLLRLQQEALVAAPHELTQEP